MPDARRPMRPAASSPASPEADPRHALAQKYLRQASAKLAEEEAEKPRAQQRRAGGAGPARAAGFTLSISPPTFLHLALAAVALTLDALALLVTYHMLVVYFVAGRIIALPAGVLTAAVLAYLSVCYLGIIESTSTGHTNVDSLSGDWREWFWTLPATLGMLAISAAFGWILSLVLPVNVWWLITLSVLLTYPIFQLSSLETGSPLAPLSIPVLRSLGRHPVAWFVLYAISFAVADLLWVIGRWAWDDPPYSTMLILGPIVTVALFFYAWLLGQLAALIGSDPVAEEET